MAETRHRFCERDAVDVVVDRSGRLGALSYRVGRHHSVDIGDAVTVPFGKRIAHGIVVGTGDPSKATREIIDVLGPRSTPELVAVATHLAYTHYSSLGAIAARLAPTDGKGADCLDAGPVALSEDVTVNPGKLVGRHLLLCSPLVESAHVAAAAAARLSDTHQVLVLCPTRNSADTVAGLFTSGAARLIGGNGCEAAAWAGFRSGTVRIGIGTRTAALWAAQQPSAVVVVDESHPGHREAQQPHTHSREIASSRTRAEGTPLVLVSTSAPSAAGLGCSVKTSVIGTHTSWPTMTVIDRGELPPEDRAIPPAVSAAVRNAVRRGDTPLIVVDGGERLWRCGRCGAPAAECPDGTTTPSVTAAATRFTGPGCERCGGTEYRRRGWDDERVEAVFGNGVDSATESTLGSRRGHGLVVVLDADRALRSARLDAPSAAMRTVVDAGRAAGEGGNVIVVHSGDDPLWDALLTQRNLTASAKVIWEAAKSAGLPPFQRMVWVRCRRKVAPDVSGWPGRVLGPTLRDGEWEIAVSMPSDQLRKLSSRISALRSRGKVRVWVD